MQHFRLPSIGFPKTGTTVVISGHAAERDRYPEHSKATANVTLSNLTQNYNGLPLTPTATTNPSSSGPNAPQTNVRDQSRRGLGNGRNSNEICGNYTVAVQVGGNYTMTNPVWYDTQVSICRATPGTIVANPTALVSNVGSGGVLAPNAAGIAGTHREATSKVSFDLKFTNKGTNPKGKARLEFVSNRDSNGQIDGNLYQYIITTNAISSLSVTGKTADFASKCNVTQYRLVPDGAGGYTMNSPISVDSGAIMQIALDGAAGTSLGVGQKLAIQVNGSKGNGGVLFSSQWNGATTILTQVSNYTLNPIAVQ